MRIRYVLLAFMCSCTMAISQTLQLNLVMNPNPSPYLSDWQTRQETIIVSITNPQQKAVQAKLMARVHQGSPTGPLIAETKFGDMPVLNLPPGATIINAEQVAPAECSQILWRSRSVYGAEWPHSFGLVNHTKLSSPPG